MNGAELRRVFDEAFRRVVLPELHEIRTEIAHAVAMQNELRKEIYFMFKQYEKLEAEFLAMKQALERIEQKLGSKKK
jgi:hypothetical protein